MSKQGHSNISFNFLVEPPDIVIVFYALAPFVDPRNYSSGIVFDIELQSEDKTTLKFKAY